MIDFELPISKGLVGYKSRPHLPRGPEGAVWQAAQREAALAKKKKKTEKAQRSFDKEKAINRRVRGGESQSDMEVELESEEPMEMGDDMSSSEDKEDRGVAVSLVERRKPTAVPIDSEHGTEVCGDVPESRKHAVGKDTTVE